MNIDSDSICSRVNNVIDEGPQNHEDNISWIIHIASATENILGPNDIEILSKNVSFFKALYDNDLYAFIKLLKDVEERNVIMLMNYKISVADNWLFQVILLNSVRNLDVSHKNSESFDYCKTETLIHIVQYIIRCTDVVKENSVFLLKTLQFILNRREVLTTSLSLDILKCMNKGALSPITSFKQIAYGISKTAVQFLSIEYQESIHNSLVLPIRGIETYTLLRLFPDKQIKTNLGLFVKKVLKLFTNSIENKDGGFLYERLLICSFEEWRSWIWPYFLEKFLQIEYEGEFFQSLIKYWIPYSVAAYRNDFYSFLKNEPIDLRLKASVLYESRKQGYPLEDANLFFYNIDTRNLGLRLATTYRKKSLCPIKSDINIVMDFLYSNLRTSLEEDELRSLKLIFSQLFFYAHNDLKKSYEHVEFYEHFVDEVYEYCYKSLNTQFLDVGAQVLHIIWTTLTGSHGDLTLLYKMDKKDTYDSGENLLYRRLKYMNMWKFESRDIVTRIQSCLMRNDYYSLILTVLILHHYSNHSFVDINIFKQVIARVESLSTLQTTEKIINCSNIFFQTGLSIEKDKFIEEIIHSLLENFSFGTNESRLFQNVLYLEILTLARRHKIKVKNLEKIIEESLHLTESILESDFLENASYKSRKVFETFVARIMYCITNDLHYLWPNMNKMAVIVALKTVINKSNMKKPVLLSIEILRQFGFKMDENEDEKVMKIKLLNETLQTICDTSLRPDLKMRRNPESRLVVHALCVSQKCPDKPLLKWVFEYLLKLLSDSQSSDFSISSSLHTIELLISDNRLQQQTLQFIPSVIIHCVEVFKKPSWIVRNANLQLAKSIIGRMYGVSLHFCNRPKSIEDLFLVFPTLATYFYKILSADVLDERSVIVFHFFLESQVKEQVFDNGVRDILDYFQILFVRIIKNYQNHFGKLAVRSYVSLCHSNNIPEIMNDITEYIVGYYTRMKKNIFANCVFLVQELFEKYENSFEHYAKPKQIVKIRGLLNNLSVFLRKFDTDLHNFLLLKVRSKSEILESLEKKNRSENRLWLINNVPFVIVNTESWDMSSILDKILLVDQPSFIHVKVLAILVSKFENNELATDDILNVLQVLFKKSMEIDDSNSYLHTCYFKVILLFMQHTGTADNPLINIPIDTSSLYKTLIYILYFSGAKSVPKKTIEKFYQVVEKRFINSLGMNEETDNDIISTFTYCRKNSPLKFRFELCKMVFYFSQFESTHLETYYFISSFMDKSYSSILCALKDFLSSKIFCNFLSDKDYVESFFVEVNRYLDGMPEKVELQDDFYIAEGDVMIPKVFLKKIVWYTKYVQNKV